ncbi:MAG: HoxN/HupN/NixA family nickel/cobalt transporter [Thermoplasmata archaeon]|nr:HoxN/HupN/NixA family nickel/cobalt transporter [Thermoplasmata archaeon]
MAGPFHTSSTVLSRAETLQVVLLYLGILGTTAVAFVALFALAGRYDTVATSTQPALTFVGLGLFAYVLGLRHGVDADHIAAIDNTTRKLIHDGERPLTVGTWFSLGHSTIVVALVVLLVAATQAVQAQLPILKSIGPIIGTTVSGTFLFVIGLVNVVIVLEVYRIFQGLKAGRFSEAELEEQLTKRGFMNRYFGRLFQVVQRPRQIYPIGVLFGLGFDTASEITLIAISVVAVAGFGASIPLYVVLVLPLLFTCGMVLVDTTDGITMRFAYGWAFLKPIRKIYYNLTVTIISILVAFVIGGIEILAVVASELGLSGGIWGTLGNLNFEDMGFAVVGLFVVTWAVAAGYYRYKGYDKITFEASTPSPGAAGGGT